MIGFHILVAVVISVRHSQGTADVGINAGEFQAMCRFIKLLRAPVKFPEIRLGSKTVNPIQAAESDLNRIGELALATESDEVFSQMTQEVQSESVKPSGDSSLTKEEWEVLAAAWKEKAKKSDETPGNPIRPPPGNQRDKTNKRITKIYQEARSLVQNVRQLDEKTKELLFEARKLQFSAVYGNKSVENQLNQGKTTPETKQWDQDIFKNIIVDTTSFADGAGGTTHVKLCGEGSEGVYNAGQLVGMSMVSDLNCLCALKTSADAENFCGAHASLASGVPSGDWGTASELKTLADKVLVGCKLTETTAVGLATPERLMAVVSQFHGMLGKGAIVHSSSITSAAKYKKQSQFILGSHNIHNSGTVKCAGAAPSNWASQSTGICVNYAHHLQNGNEVPWVKNVIGAAETLKEAEQTYNVILSFLVKIENLRNRAEIYYEGAFEGHLTEGNAARIHPGTKHGNDSMSGNTPVANAEKEALSGSTTRFAENSLASGIFMLLVTIH